MKNLLKMITFHQMKYNHNFLLFTVITFSFAIRIIGIPWGFPPFDPGYYHPDEIKIVEGAYLFPTDIFYRMDFRYPTGYHYLIGILWLIFKPILSFISTLSEFSLLYIFSRIISVIIGTLTIFFLYKLISLIQNKNIALISALFLGISMFHVNNSAWATTDVPTSLFFILFLISVKKLSEDYSYHNIILSGYAFGILIGIKYTGFISIVAFFLVFLSFWLSEKNKTSLIKKLLFFFMLSFFVFFLTTPGIIFHPKGFYESLLYEFNRVDSINASISIFHQFFNFIRAHTVTMGIPLTILYLLGVVNHFYRYDQRRKFERILLIVLLFFYLSIGVSAFRYLLLVIPLICYFAANGLMFMYDKLKILLPKTIFTIIFLFILIYSSIYSFSAPYFRRPDTRTIALDYIYESIPENSTIGLSYVSYEMRNIHYSRYPPINKELYTFIDLLDKPEYLIISSYDKEIFINIFNKEEPTNLSKMDFEKIIIENVWYRNSPPSIELLNFYFEFLYRKNSDYVLVKEFKPSSLLPPTELPPPTIEIYKLKINDG